MPSTVLDVKVYPAGSESEPDVFRGVDYISFVSSPGGAGTGTYGIPAMINDDDKLTDGQIKLLYVNPANISAMHVHRHPR